MLSSGGRLKYFVRQVDHPEDECHDPITLRAFTGLRSTINARPARKATRGYQSTHERSLYKDTERRWCAFTSVIPNLVRRQFTNVLQC